jgi:cephalosporin-C deacetylase-like acetyl esterase
MDKAFYITQDELMLKFSHGKGARALAFSKTDLEPDMWRAQTRRKLAELLSLECPVSVTRVKPLRQSITDGVHVTALVMSVSDDLSIPAYLLEPRRPQAKTRAVIAIHGHGEVEPCIGAYDDYHHSFALELARGGYIVLCPELRGFGALKDVARQGTGTRLDYWNWGKPMAYSLVTDGMLHGKPLIGETVEDLLCWEDWLANEKGIQAVDVAGISYGGDLAITYPAFSERVERIFTSGTLGSFSVIFSRCYNAPAHCVPGILRWMDRSDIAGLNAPRPLALHYGELDVPGPHNFSASYNETGPGSLKEVEAIYRAFGAEGQVKLVVSPGKHHEMDNHALASF